MSTKGVNLREVQTALEDAGFPWQAAPNPISALSPEDRALLLGFTPGPNQLSLRNAEIQQRALNAAAEALDDAVTAPARFDLRNVGGKNYITSVKHQGNCGSCVAFGACATVEGTLRRLRDDPNLAVDLSEAHLFYCHARDDGRRCSGANGGWWPERAYEAFKSKGVADQACYPYTAGDQNCTNLCSDWQNRVLKISGYKDLTGNRPAIKEWIATKGPVSACMLVYSDFYSYNSGVYKHVSGDLEGGHCVTIVGYDDNPGYWICKNSWGTSWGMSGFFNIAYGECDIDTYTEGNHGVEGVVASGWQTGKKVTGLWVNNQERNAWVHVDGLGWRKVASDNDNIFFDLLAMLISAKAGNRTINFFEDNGVVKEVYVF